MLDLHLQIDQTRLPFACPAFRHLIARITPPASCLARKPVPLDLAIVIDASGSMRGAPLDAARSATLELARSLPASTRLTVVSFADDVVVHADQVLLDEAGREEVILRTAGITTRGCTNLYAGWRTACSMLAAGGEESVARSRRIVLLSDGHANRGTIDPLVLADESRTQAALGIATSCIGIGDGYSPDQLRAIAEHGGGECHDAADAIEIVEIARGEVQSFREVAAEGVELVLDLPIGIEAMELSGLPMSVRGTRAVVTIGAVHVGIDRTLVLRLAIPSESGDESTSWTLEFSAHLEWRDPGSLTRCTSATRITRAQRSSDPAEAPQLPVARAVLGAWQAHLARCATTLNRKDDQSGLERLWSGEGESFRIYSRFHADTREFELGVDHIRIRCRRPIDERTRRVADDLARKSSRQGRVLYGRSKGSLLQQFDDLR
jgi:Ca-activated chloride channel family protein